MPRDARAHWRSLLWRTWETFGVSSWERGAPGTVVDPEALILATLAHEDLRLRNETIDWAVEHEHLVHGRRLATLARGTNLELRTAEWLAAVAAGGRADEHGSARSGKSAPRSEKLRTNPATAALRMRALTGTTARSELVRALHGVLVGVLPPLSATELVTSLGLTRAHVNRALADLVAAGFVAASGTPRRQRYAPIEHDPLAASLWEPWRSFAFAPWLDATRAASALVAARDLVDGTPGVGAVSDALAIYQSHAQSLELVTGRREPLPEPGAAAQVAPRLIELLDRVITDIVRALDAPTAARTRAPYRQAIARP